MLQTRGRLPRGMNAGWRSGSSGARTRTVCSSGYVPTLPLAYWVARVVSSWRPRAFARRPSPSPLLPPAGAPLRAQALLSPADATRGARAVCPVAPIPYRGALTRTTSMPRALYVRATRTSLPRAVRTRGAQGSLPRKGRRGALLHDATSFGRAVRMHTVAPHRWPSSCCATQSTSCCRRHAFYRVSYGLDLTLTLTY